ncbi:amidohydrolase family protein [Marinimicrococcus flavescens]|uniref:Amidohydrolase family protein n=1 Tax=Marinimicrococcus flavescens TaxID=3031815 RepID=A0AAP3V1R0_9PROT|nr:amidohydrolase family protein [Marinimicrococcus flavescens]
MPDIVVIRGGRLADAADSTAPLTDILVEGDTIREIGAPGLEAPEHARTIDAAGMLLHAGLVNGHTHGHGNLAKGMGDRWSLELLLTAAPWIGGNRQLEDKYLTTLIGAAEMLLKGCTACYDLTFEFPAPTVEGIDAVARAYSDAGMRAVVAPMVADTTFYDAIPGLLEALPEKLRQEVAKARLAPAETTLERIRAILEGWSHDTASIRAAVAPTIPHHCSDAFLAGCRDLARAHKVGLHSHVAESKLQAIVGRERYGRTQLAHMDAMGLVGPDFVVAHGVWLDDDDMRRLAAHGASVSHNPGSNALLGSGIADARRMLELGVNLAIGTDGANCSDNQNMYEAMRMAAYASHARGPDTGLWLSTAEIFKAATEGSARALGFERLGRIAPGYKADIVFLDLASINLIPLNDAVNQLVQTEDGSSVHSVMVGGRMVVENRRLVGCDMARLAADAERARERLAAANAGARELFGKLAPVVGSFCPGLMQRPYHVHRFASCAGH